MSRRSSALRADRRWHRSVRRAGIALIPGLIAMTTGAPTAGAKSTVSGDHAEIAKIEAEINSEGNTVQAIVSRYNTLSGQLAVINGKIATAQTQLAKDEKATSHAATYLREVAISAYVNAQSGNTSGLSSFTGTGAASSVQEKNVYLGTVNGSLESATATLTNDEQDVTATEHTLAIEQAETAQTLQLVVTACQQAQSAINADEATLRKVNGNLLALVNTAEARRAQAHEAAAERAIAVATTQRSAESAPSSASVTPTPSSGSYANPLRSISGLGPERIDQGVDFRGFGPIYALGDGVVISTVNGGWPAGTFITYRLTDGPAAGLAVYAAEDIEPTVSVGQRVTPATQIGTVYEGSYGIEVGWADPAGNGTTMAADNNEYYGSNTTTFGYNFSQLLSSLGAPGGQVQNSPTGAVPSAWPNW